jgi:hypothetical protein
MNEADERMKRMKYFVWDHISISILYSCSFVVVKADILCIASFRLVPTGPYQMFAATFPDENYSGLYLG